MSRPVKIILLAVAVVIGGWVAYSRIIKTMYLEPRAAALASIEKATTTLAEYRKNQQDHPRVDTAIRGVIDRTLGGDLETVDHRLRTRLNRLAEQLQIRNAAVGTTGQVKPRESPAKSRFSSNRALRDEFDFCELEAWINGAATFEQALALVDAIEAEPWIKRIDELKLDPRDNGARFNVSIRLTTLFLPGRAPKGELQAPPADPSRVQRYASLAAINPFRLPPPPPAQPKPVEAVAAGPPPFPFDQWTLTGIAQSPAGLEIWLLNRSTQEARRLAVGERLHDVEFVAAHGEWAEFRTGDERFSVAVGGILSDRTLVNQ